MPNLSPLDLQRKKVELMRVQAARAEMELHISEKLAEIERMKISIEIQKQTEKDLKQIISSTEGITQ